MRSKVEIADDAKKFQEILTGLFGDGFTAAELQALARELLEKKKRATFLKYVGHYDEADLNSLCVHLNEQSSRTRSK